MQKINIYQREIDDIRIKGICLMKKIKELQKLCALVGMSANVKEQKTVNKRGCERVMELPSLPVQIG